MKKLLSVFLSLAMMLTMFASTPLTAQAAEYTTTIDGIEYKIDTKKGEAYVSSAEDWIFIANILSEVDGCAVTGIAESAFRYCESLKSVTISDNVTSIGMYAFQNCESLESLTIGNSVVTIGLGAFWECTSLTEVAIPDSVTNLNAHAFSKCSSLSKVTIGNSVTSIDQNTFMNCNSLSEVIIGNGVTSIGQSAFENCTSLSTVKFGNSVTSIYSYAFYKCRALTDVELPDSVKSIGVYAFYDCDALNEITFGRGIQEISDYSLGYYDNESGNTQKRATMKIYCYNYTAAQFYAEENRFEFISFIVDNETDEAEVCSASKSITAANIPSKFYEYSVTSIGDSAFEDCTSLTTVTIGSGVESIGVSAFSGCTSLKSIKIPNSVTSIGYNAFYNTAYYNDETNWENGVLYIDNCLIKANESISGDYTIKDGTRLIADRAFYDCTALTSITIPDSVTSIGYVAFVECESLASINVSENNQNYSSENGVLFNKDKTLIIQYPAGKANTTYEILDGVTSIGEGAFYDCTALTSITIPDSVTEISRWAFGNCTSLTAVEIGKEVKSINYGAFLNCTSLIEVTIPDSVTSIGEGAFGYYTDDNGDTQRIEEFTICGYADSAAETYANDNGFTFISLGQEQPTTTQPTTTEPTFTTTTTTAPTTTTTTQSPKGDTNGDGKVSIADARKIVVAIAKNNTVAMIEFGDVNGDGKISVADVRKIVIAIAKNDFNF